ncbi:hypothetical protein RJ639_043641 [Escallonia herrerae]|uniref:Reverse transcriptase domain-containing protein n=1 Tax=Escallonia herrerae TaxID=1293975 RepID=A0AA88W939_9ASTE|nr:hypothetical protein RJ639_043641 [Escallonia herrerae]
MEHLWLSSNPSFPNDLEGLLPRVLIGEEVLRLQEIPLITEISSTLMKFSNLKAPEPNEMTSLFYKTYWESINFDVCRTIQSFFSGNSSLLELNHTNIALIPKIPSPTKAEHYRPISLCNVIYKVISKLLANKLKPLLTKIILPMQSAFVHGRLINDNKCSGTILLGQTRVRPFWHSAGQSVQERFCSDRTVLSRLALCSGRVFGNNSTLAEPCLAIWHSARVECSGTILLGQNSARTPFCRGKSSARSQFCSDRIVFDILSLYSSRVGNDYARANSCLAVLSLCSGRVLRNNSARVELCRLALYSGRVFRNDSAHQNRVRPFGTLLWQSVRAPFCSGRTVFGRLALCSGRVSGHDSAQARLLSLQEPANYGTKYETGIYKEQVKSGYRLPLHPFALCFFYHYHMTPGQLVPNGKLPFDREWNPYCKDFENLDKPTPNNLTKHILSHIKLRGRLSIDEPLSEQQLEWARIIPCMPVLAGVVTPPLVPTISSTFPAESTPPEMASGSGKAAQGDFLGVLQKAKGKRKEKQPSAELPLLRRRQGWTLCSDDVGMPDSQISEQHLVHRVLPRDKEIFQNQTHETFTYSFAQAVYTIYASGSEMLSCFEMVRQVAAEEAQQKREAIKEAGEATHHAEELSKQETDYLAQIETLEMRLERAKRRVAEEVKKARDQGIRDFHDGNTGDDWLKKRADDGLEIYELGFTKAKEMFAKRFPDISLDDFVLPAVISLSGETVLLSEAGDAADSHPPGEGPSGDAPEP